MKAAALVRHRPPAAGSDEVVGVGGCRTCIIDTRCRIAIRTVNWFYQDGRDSKFTTSAATLFEEAGF